MFLVGVAIALAFSDIRLGGPGWLVTEAQRAGSRVCGVNEIGLCLRVHWPTELMVMGGWIAAFWSFLALVRVEPARSRATGSLLGGNASMSGVVQGAGSQEPDGPPPSLPSRSKGPWSDARLLAWIVGGTVAALSVFVVGFLVLFGLRFGDPSTPTIDDVSEGPPFLLSADDPSSVAIVTFAANDEAAEAAAVPYLELAWDVRWSGVSPRHRVAIIPEVSRTDGVLITDLVTDVPGRLTCIGQDCLGAYRVSFPWPAGLAESPGALAITWRVYGAIEFQEAIPDDASVEVRIT
jgi:hypothetical protein